MAGVRSPWIAGFMRGSAGSCLAYVIDRSPHIDDPAELLWCTFLRGEGGLAGAIFYVFCKSASFQGLSRHTVLPPPAHERVYVK